MEKLLEHKSLFAGALAAVVLLYGVAAWGPAKLHSPFFLPAATISSPGEPAPASQPPLFQYIEVADGCGPYFEGACINMRSGPGLEYPVIMQLRTGAVLKVAEATTSLEHVWYKILSNEGLRYPERVSKDWYVSADAVELFTNEGDKQWPEGAPATGDKRIVVDRSDQTLYAYEGEALFMQEPISTGLEFTPTPRGTFTVYYKTPSRYMQGPLPGISEQYYDLPGVPWNLYFTYQGAVIHGAYWHDRFGEPWSHGCVNLPPQKAKELYRWANVGTQVIVRD